MPCSHNTKITDLCPTQQISNQPSLHLVLQKSTTGKKCLAHVYDHRANQTSKLQLPNDNVLDT